MMGGPSYSFTMHGPEEFDVAPSNLLAQKVHHAAFVVAISEFTRSQLYRWAEYRDWSKIHVIRVGVSQMFLDRGPVPIPMSSSFSQHWPDRRTEGPGNLGPGSSPPD